MPDTNRKSNTEPVKIGDCLQEFMQNVVEMKSGQYQAINSVWKKIVPENLAEHCKVAEIENGIVQIEADSPSAVFELRMEGKRILSVIQKSCPAMRIKRLKFAVK